MHKILMFLVVLALAFGAASTAQAATVQSTATYPGYNVWNWFGADKCNAAAQGIQISEPAVDGKYPVAVYVHGTTGDWGPNTEGKRIAQTFAEAGFVAAAPKYDSLLTNSPSGVDGHANCIFNPSKPASVVTKLCARAKADCSKGVVAVGFSQGGAIVARSKNFNSGVRAAVGMGVSGPDISAAIATPTGTRALPNDRLRIHLGQSDFQSAGAGNATLNKLTGQTCSGFNCLRADGSGYYVVSHAEVQDKVADHCYWQVNGCSFDPVFDPGFAVPNTGPWSLLATRNWLAKYTN